MSNPVEIAPLNVALELGVVGPQGGTGTFIPGDTSYEHVQSVASALWTINHNLGFRPSVSVFDSVGDQVEGQITHITDDTLTITYSAAFAGVAYLT